MNGYQEVNVSTKVGENILRSLQRGKRRHLDSVAQPERTAPMGATGGTVSNEDLTIVSRCIIGLFVSPSIN